MTQTLAQTTTPVVTAIACQVSVEKAARLAKAAQKAAQLVKAVRRHKVALPAKVAQLVARQEHLRDLLQSHVTRTRRLFLKALLQANLHQALASL